MHASKVVTGEIDQINHAGLLRFPMTRFEDLIEMDGHDSMCSTTRGIHIRCRYSSILGSFGNPSFNILIAADWDNTQALWIEGSRCRMLSYDKSWREIGSSFRFKVDTNVRDVYLLWGNLAWAGLELVHYKFPASRESLQNARIN